MPWDGSGTYSPPVATFPESNGTVIDADRYNPTISDLAAGITACLTKDGQNVPVANLAMGGFKHTGADVATNSGEYVTFNQTGVRLPILGIGTVPAAWDASGSAIDLATTGALWGDNGGAGLALGYNTYFNTGFKAKTTNVASYLAMNSSGLIFATAVSVTAGAAQTFVDKLKATIDGRLYGTALHNNPNSIAGATEQYIASGTYNPAIANQSNITSVVADTAQYMRVGNVVTVSGQVTVTPASAASATFSLSLPIAVTGVLGVTNKVSGVLTLPGALLTPRIRGSGLAAPQVAWIQATYPGTSAYVGNYTFTYLVE